MEADHGEEGVSDQVSIYTVIDGIVAAHMTASGIPYQHETYVVFNGRPPDTFAVFSVISDVNDGFYRGVKCRTEYRVQLDLVFPKGDKAGLYTAYAALEAVLVAGGARPQGNYRMNEDDAGHPYIQKDYKITTWGDT